MHELTRKMAQIAFDEIRNGAGVERCRQTTVVLQGLKTPDCIGTKLQFPQLEP